MPEQEIASSRPERIHDEISDRIVQIVAGIAEKEGAHKVTVRKITNELGVTNRVFYNRFSNCDEVLRIVYRNAFVNIRENIRPDFHDRDSFLKFCVETAVSVTVRLTGSPRSSANTAVPAKAEIIMLAATADAKSAFLIFVSSL